MRTSRSCCLGLPSFSTHHRNRIRIAEDYSLLFQQGHFNVRLPNSQEIIRRDCCASVFSLRHKNWPATFLFRCLRTFSMRVHQSPWKLWQRHMVHMNYKNIEA